MSLSNLLVGLCLNPQEIDQVSVCELFALLACQLEMRGKCLEYETIFSFSYTKAVNSTQTSLFKCKSPIVLVYEQNSINP